MSDSLQPHEHQASLSFTSSQSSRANSCLLSRWCHPTISSSVTTFSYCLQSFPASGPFPVSWLLASGGQSIRASGSASVLPINIQGCFPLGLTDLISLLSKGLSRVLSSTTVQKHQFFDTQLSLWSNSHNCDMTNGRKQIWLYGHLSAKWCLRFFNMLTRFIIPFLPRNKCLLISWLQLPSSVILEPKKIKSVTVFIVPPSICYEVMGPDAMIFVFWNTEF